MFLWTIPTDGDIKVDVFLFKDHLEKIKWILHDVHMYLSYVLLTYIIHSLTKKHERRYLSDITLVFLGFAIFRLLEYFTFRGTIPMWALVTGIILWTLGKLYNGHQNLNS